MSKLNPHLDSSRLAIRTLLSINAITGAFLCDDIVTKDEIIFLNTWLLNTRDNVFYGRFKEPLFDEFLTETYNILDSDISDEQLHSKFTSIYCDFYNKGADVLDKLEVYKYFDYRESCIIALQGLCAGIVADGELNQKEFDYVIETLEELEDALLLDPICSRFYMVISELTDDEKENKKILKKLEKLIIDFSGITDDLCDGNSLGEEFFDKVGAIDFTNKVVCFTGKFQYGSRKKCSELAKQQGARVVDDWSFKVDFMIIGNLSSNQWMYQNYGRKIEWAKEAQQKRGHHVKIITEGQWFNSSIIN
ncbi:BRCT domain-containing protein [Pasteurella skyensis]|uniref:BRCT domain-containing protein n=1 Tax=Phocoenobacter skyensis TaxID=97481 RepID=A0AAJ6NBD5_9PAST|nr:BRCT domain-containing protein [Pasteurella skyensis]MDP8173650.1 BRCT domain-containing protein [Pasteurella skyensis]MDP8178018.1 BRCT domain-containing protein [Pasteurella skyensis]